MKNHILILDGRDFSDLNGFYATAYRILTQGLDWPVAHNFDAFHDILHGGFGVFESVDKVTIKWLHFSKSQKDLGLYPSISYYGQRASELTGKRAHYFQQKAEDLKNGLGETLIETIVNIIALHENITLVLKN